MVDELDEELDAEELDCDFRPVKEFQIDILVFQIATHKVMSLSTRSPVRNDDIMLCRRRKIIRYG